MTENRPLITTIESSGEDTFVPPDRVLLRPSYTPARTGIGYQDIRPECTVGDIYSEAIKSQYLVVDFETKGSDYSSNIEIIGVGLAWDTGSCYFHYTDLWDTHQRTIQTLLFNHPRLVAHNVYFDGGVLYSIFGRHPNWDICTLALYMFLSNEGWAGQSHGLKSAQKEILMWPESNEKDLDYWLITNGFYKGNQLADESPEHLHQRATEGTLAPRKEEMWRAPADILGKYCVLDAESTYLLLEKHLLPVAEKFPQFLQWFRERWMPHILIHIEQKCLGMPVDREGLLARHEYLSEAIREGTEEVLSLPELRPGIEAIELELLQPVIESEPEKYKKERVRPPEPPRFNKNGSQSRNWEKWVENEHKYRPEVSLNWVKWEKKVERIRNGELEEYKFNLRSGRHLSKLFYQHLGYPIRVLTEKEEPGTGIKALKHFGEAGQKLIELAYLEKELSYIQDYCDRTEHRGTLHPNFRLPGTKTGRVSSNQINVMQVPKSKAVMSLFTAYPGMKLIDIDFSALEPCVLTEFSRDENLMRIYGPGMPANDIYLFVAFHVPSMTEKLRATGYDPHNPTPESIGKAKKECKRERSLCKTAYLAWSYGAGWRKLQATFELDDIFLSDSEAQELHSAISSTFPAVKGFSRQLEEEWQENGGYLLNGMGRPICVTEDYKHDILNRFVQSTGHDVLTEYCYIMTGLLDQQVPGWMPYIFDLHDAVTIQVPSELSEVAVAAFNQGMGILNGKLNGTIRLRGVPVVGDNLAECKEPES